MNLAATPTQKSSAMQWLSLRWRSLRAFSLPVSMLPVAVATAAVLPVQKWNWPVLLASLFGAGLMHCAGNLFNDYFDFLKGVDRKLDGDENRPGRLLVKGQMKPGEVLSEALFCLLLAGGLGAYVVCVAGPAILWFALAGAVALYAYTGPPLALKYRAMGEALIFVTFGPLLLLGAAFAQTGRVEWPAFLASIPVGLATTAILVGNNVRDMEEDAVAGITTLNRILGHNALRVVYIALVCLSALSLSGMAIVGAMPRVLIAAPVLLVLATKPLSAVAHDRRMPDVDARTAQFETVLLLAMLVSLIVEKWR